MGGKPLNGCRIVLVAPRAWKDLNWTRDQVEKWVKNAGGALQKGFDEQSTTHVVAEEPAWKNKISHVKAALEANDNGGKVYIVTPEWLHACLSEQKKYREKNYLWEKLEQDAAGGTQKKIGAQGGDGEEEAENDEVPRKTHQAMLGEVLQEGTEYYIEDHDIREYEAKLAGIQKAEREREEAEAKRKAQEKEALEQQRRQRAAEMKKTAKKGRGEEFNKNYHPFKDSTGFVYDIMLTRVDTLTNRNERINITLFESNAVPHTYATNIHFAGTGKQPMNNILAAIGSNFETAMRFFYNTFQEKTKVHWDDRIKAHNERVKARNHDADTPGPGSTRFGENGSVKSKARAAEEKKPFEYRAFEYMPPTYGNKGWLPDGKETMPEHLKQIRRATSNGQRERTEQWMMSNENGMSPEAISQSPHQSTEKTQHPTHIDLTEDEPAEHVSVSSAASSDDDDVSDSNDNNADEELAKTAEEAAAADDLLNGASTGAFDFESLIAGTTEWPTQDVTFDLGDATQQQQQDFVFDEDFKVNAGNEPLQTPATGLDTDQHIDDGLDAKDTTPAADNADLQTSLADDETVGGTLPGQTQLAAMVAEDLLNVETAAGGLVMIPEEQLEASASVEKRKRSPDDGEAMEPAAKRFEGEELAT